MLIKFSQEYLDLAIKEFEQSIGIKLKANGKVTDTKNNCFSLIKIKDGYYYLKIDKNRRSEQYKKTLLNVIINSQRLAMTKYIWQILLELEISNSKDSEKNKLNYINNKSKNSRTNNKINTEYNSLLNNIKITGIPEETKLMIIKKIYEYNWASIIKGKYSVSIKKIKNKNYNENKINPEEILTAISNIIWERLIKEGVKPDISMENAQTKIYIIYEYLNNNNNNNNISQNNLNSNYIKYNKPYKLKIILGKLIYINKQKFDKRRADKRPCLKPISLSPKLARACINLLGLRIKIKGSNQFVNLSKNTPKKDNLMYINYIKNNINNFNKNANDLKRLFKDKRIIDPCCGTGGFLIEAGLIGYTIIGSDYSEEMIKCTRKNLKAYNLKAEKLVKIDITKIRRINKNKPLKKDQTFLNYFKQKYHGLITDLPYGKNTKKIKDLNKEYKKFLTSFKQISDKMVVIFPSYVNYEKIIKDSNLKLKYFYKIKVHNKLNRIITVIEKDSKNNDIAENSKDKK